MYSLKLLHTPTRCYLRCGRVVTRLLAPHYYTHPVCDVCLLEADPALARAYGLRPAAIQPLESRADVTCANCGDSLDGRRFAGYHLGEPLCTVCFEPHEPELGGLLLLGEAALEAAAGGHAKDWLEVAIHFARRLLRLDADHPRAPVLRLPKDPDGGDQGSR